MPQLGFDCPNCGDTTVIEGDRENIAGRVYRCEGCKKNVLVGGSE